MRRSTRCTAAACRHATIVRKNGTSLARRRAPALHLTIGSKPRDLPPLAILPPHETVRFPLVRECELGRIPLEQLVGKAHRDTPKHHRFGERTGVVEVGGRILAREAGFGP